MPPYVPLDNRSGPRRNQSSKGLPTRIITGFNRSLYFLLLHGIISVLWGAALCVFALLQVQIGWSISQVGINNPAFTNTAVALVATLSTLHITYVLQRVIEEYSKSLLLSGFTLGQLTWLQGVKEMSVFVKFPAQAGGGRLRAWSTRRLLWLVVDAGFAFHASSLVSILQPHIFFDHVYYYDPVPCGVDISNLTLAGDLFLNDTQQQYIDSLSFGIGMQLANYGDQVSGNTTTAVAGRVYAKDSYAYGAVGGLINGLQEIPGVLFSATCSTNATDSLSIWQATFSDRTPPKLSVLPKGLRNFTDAPVPPQIGTVISDAEPFNFTANHAALYALVEPSGSGALITVSASSGANPNSLVCSWKTLPKLMHVQTVNYTTGTLSTNDSDVYPSLIGRATLTTLQGMAQAARLLGAALQDSAGGPGGPYFNTPVISMSYYRHTTSVAQVLEVLLADGGKAGMTAYNVHEWQLIYTADTAPVPARCNPQVRTVQEHWRFGNTHNLGWIATVWTTGVGLLAIWTAFRMARRRRVADVRVLDVAQAFSLGRGDVLSDDRVLFLSKGKVEVRKNIKS